MKGGMDVQEQTENIRNELYMPTGLKMKKELFPGFTRDDLIPTIISGIVFIILDCILWMFGMQNIGILFFVPVVGVTTVMFMMIKGELNLSPVDFIRMEFKFAREQRYYPYIAKNEWENIA